MSVINAAAQFEWGLLIARTQSGLRIAKGGGKLLDRHTASEPIQRATIWAELEVGATVSTVTRRRGTNRQTIMRTRAEA